MGNPGTFSLFEVIKDGTAQSQNVHIILGANLYENYVVLTIYKIQPN